MASPAMLFTYPNTFWTFEFPFPCWYTSVLYHLPVGSSLAAVRQAYLAWFPYGGDPTIVRFMTEAQRARLTATRGHAPGSIFSRLRPEAELRHELKWGRWGRR
jgi:hypothetical protein